MADYSIEVSIPNVGPQGPQGEIGPVGPANELTLGEVTTGDPGTEAEATISGSPPNQMLDLVLPRGETGAQGNPGPTGAGGVGVVPAPIYATMQEAVEDGITFGGVFRHTSGSVYWVEEPDPDAATFIAASGATDVWNLQKFVQGVKALGLWDDMVCWPLRSAQNAGTGTTAYSLGGLGAYNGTLVNGPTWGVDGISFDGSNDYITTALRITELSVTEFAIASAFNLASDSTNFAFVFGQDTSGASGGAGSLRRNGTASSINFAVTLGASQADNIQGSVGSFSIHSGRVAGSSSFHAVGSASENEVVGAGAYNPTSLDFVGFGARNKNATPQLYGKMENAFGAVIKGSVTSSALASFRALYKTTLGIGLNLP